MIQGGRQNFELLRIRIQKNRRSHTVGRPVLPHGIRQLLAAYMYLPVQHIVPDAVVQKIAGRLLGATDPLLFGIPRSDGSGTGEKDSQTVFRNCIPYGLVDTEPPVIVEHELWSVPSARKHEPVEVLDFSPRVHHLYSDIHPSEHLLACPFQAP